MTANFPTSLDTLVDPTASDKLNSATVPHASQHSDLNNIVEALEAKVGIDGSTVPTSLDYKMGKQSVVPFADAAARTTAVPSPVEGQMSYLEDTNSVQVYNGSAWAALAGGKILQIVRATDTTNRTTTSGTYADANISVTITPTDATSNILLIWAFVCYSGTGYGIFQITDPSNVAITGFDRFDIGGTASGTAYDAATLLVWDSPASTSAQTYKGRFRTSSSTTIRNSYATGQLFAIEVGA